MKIRTIIVGVDFKDNTLKLCKEAVKFAQKLNSSITLVHAIEEIYHYPYFPHDEKIVGELTNVDIKWQLDQLESFIKDYSIEVCPSVISPGRPYDIICSTANNFDTSAIVIGVGSHYLFEELIGSTAEKVSRMAKQKVIIVNETKSENIQKVMSAFDFSDNSFSALFSAVRLAQFFKAELKIIHVHNTDSDNLLVADQVSLVVSKLIENELENSETQSKTIPHDIIIRKGIPVLEIFKCVDEKGIDLLSIGSSGHSDFKRFFLGSTVAKIIRKTPCRVVVSPKE